MKRNIAFLIDEDIAESYKAFCEEKGTTMADELRSYVIQTTENYMKSKKDISERSFDLARELAIDLIKHAPEGDYIKINKMLQSMLTGTFNDKDRHQFINTKFRDMYSLYNLKFPRELEMTPDEIKSELGIKYHIFTSVFITEMISQMFG